VARTIRSFFYPLDQRCFKELQIAAERISMNRIPTIDRKETSQPMWHYMRKLLILTSSLLILASLERVQASSLITNPIVMVTPMTLDFGAVKGHTTVTNTLLVENAGGGKLVGKATVAAPFKIISGASYSLKEDTAQVVTIIYTPNSASADTQTVTFTGGGGAKVAVTGKATGSGTGGGR
jgi:hypothetical protein